MVFRWTTASLTVLSLLFGFAMMVGAQTPSFEIVVPLSTVVRAPEGSVTVLESTETPDELVGESCRVTAESENQSSVHPGNDLLVESGTSIVLEDVEAQPGGTVTASGTMVLSEEIVISLLMGPDEVFSAGIQVQFDCPPEPTTTTSEQTTTTSEATTTTAEPTTTTTALSTTITTAPETTTTVPSTTTTIGPATTTTIEDEVLAFTGPEDNGLGLVALGLAALGVMMLIAERNLSYSPSGRSLVWKQCRRCARSAVFSTPHGGLCVQHTRKALNQDQTLWMPRRLV